MPTYEHECPECYHRFEEVRPIRDFDKNPECPVCGTPKCPQVFSPPGISGLVGAQDTTDDKLTRQRYGLKKGERVHQNYITGEVLKFDRFTTNAKAEEAIRQSYIKAGVKAAENSGEVKVAR